MHFHVPPLNPDGKRPTSRQMNAYTANLRSRSQSRTGMKVLVDQLDVSAVKVYFNVITTRTKRQHNLNVIFVLFYLKIHTYASQTS